MRVPVRGIVAMTQRRSFDQPSKKHPYKPLEPSLNQKSMGLGRSFVGLNITGVRDFPYKVFILTVWTRTKVRQLHESQS